MSKYKVSIELELDFEDDSVNPFELTEKFNKKIPGLDKAIYDFKIKVKELLDPRSNQGKIVYGVFSPNDVLINIKHCTEKVIYKTENGCYAVRMNSDRYHTFNKSLVCAACGLLGEKMVLEKSPVDTAPHFNLYGVEKGELILMTKDHVIPKSKGGKNVLENYATMCSICNGLKGNDFYSYEEVKRLRAIYNLFRFEKVVNKKEYIELLTQAKESIKAARNIVPLEIGT